jgi:hypothetical protein
LSFVVAVSNSTVSAQTIRDDFRQGLGLWVVEQVNGGKVVADKGVLDIEDKGGCTVWLRQKLKAPIHIHYKVTLIEKGGPCDRVSDLNCFWMAFDPAVPDDFFKQGNGRDGRFASYDRLKTYYVGCGGNTNSSTRFRRYSGDGKRPLLPEHDLSQKQFLLEGNREYTIDITSDGEWIEYKRDGVTFFRWRDTAPLTEGYFGFRTVTSHQRITDFEVTEGK